MVKDELSREERNFAEQTRNEREQRGWSQEELAAQMRECDLPYVNQTTVSRIENGTRPVRLMESQALSVIFNRTVLSMTNPDGRETILKMIEANEKSRRRAYAQFKTFLREAAEHQSSARNDLSAIEKLYGDDELDPETAAKVRALRENLTNFSTIDLAKESMAIIESARGAGEHG